MRGSVAANRVIMLAGVILVTLFAVIQVANVVFKGLESSSEAQAKVMANMVAISVNTLEGTDAGYVRKSFDLKEPFVVEVYDKNGVMYVKVMYDSKNNKFYEVPLQVKIDPIAPTNIDRIYVMKDMGGQVYIQGELREGRDVTLAGDMGCRQPTPDEIKQYVTEASQKSGVEEARIKAVMKQESIAFCQCKGCRDGFYLESGAGAVGLMQLMLSTAAEVGVNRYDARENVIGGAMYLSKMYNQFHSWELAYAAYNAGPAKLSKCMPECGLTAKSTSQDIKNCACLKDETRNYVPYVSGYYSSCFVRGAVCNPKECSLC